MMPITEEVHAFLTANAAAQIQRDDEYLDPADGLLHCKTCHGLRQTVIPAPGGTGFLRPRCCAPARVLRKNSAKRQKKNGSVWNAFSGEKHMGYRIAASTIARLPTITEKRQG